MIHGTYSEHLPMDNTNAQLHGGKINTSPHPQQTLWKVQVRRLFGRRNESPAEEAEWLDPKPIYALTK